MFDTFTRTPFFGLTLIFICWVLGVKFQKKTGWLLCNPVLTSALMIVVILTVTGVPLKHFNAGGSIITMLLGPATAVLALNIYQQRQVLQENFLPILVGCTIGSLGSIIAALALCHLFRTNSVFSASMLPSIVIGLVSARTITAGAVVITGIEGAVLAPFLGKLFHITDPVAEGVAIGACSHAVGTSKALEIGKIQGAMSSISLCVCGIITTGLALFFM